MGNHAAYVLSDSIAYGMYCYVRRFHLPYICLVFSYSVYGRSFGPTCPYGLRYMTLPFAWWVARTSTSAICTCAGAEAA